MDLINGTPQLHWLPLPAGRTLTRLQVNTHAGYAGVLTSTTGGSREFYSLCLELCSPRTEKTIPSQAGAITTYGHATCYMYTCDFKRSPFTSRPPCLGCPFYTRLRHHLRTPPCFRLHVSRDHHASQLSPILPPEVTQAPRPTPPHQPSITHSSNRQTSHCCREVPRRTLTQIRTTPHAFSGQKTKRRMYQAHRSVTFATCRGH